MLKKYRFPPRETKVKMPYPRQRTLNASAFLPLICFAGAVLAAPPEVAKSIAARPEFAIQPGAGLLKSLENLPSSRLASMPHPLTYRLAFHEDLGGGADGDYEYTRRIESATGGYIKVIDNFSLNTRSAERNGKVESWQQTRSGTSYHLLGGLLPIERKGVDTRTWCSMNGCINANLWAADDGTPLPFVFHATEVRGAEQVVLPPRTGSRFALSYKVKQVNSDPDPSGSDVKLACTVGAKIPASTLHAALHGEATALQCTLSERYAASGKVTHEQVKDYYLSDFGIFLSVLRGLEGIPANEGKPIPATGERINYNFGTAKAPDYVGRVYSEVSLTSEEITPAR